MLAVVTEVVGTGFCDGLRRRSLFDVAGMYTHGIPVTLWHASIARIAAHPRTDCRVGCDSSIATAGRLSTAGMPRKWVSRRLRLYYHLRAWTNPLAAVIREAMRSMSEPDATSRWTDQITSLSYRYREP